MTEKKVNEFLKRKASYFPKEKLEKVKKKMLKLTDSDYYFIKKNFFWSPIAVQILSVFLGWFGVDRLVLDDYLICYFKMFTLGGCGILMVYDWFTIYKKTKIHNYEKLIYET